MLVNLHSKQDKLEFCFKDDELDSLTLDFTSFSENKVNKKLVLEFTMNQILARKEFLINEVIFFSCCNSFLKFKIFNLRCSLNFLLKQQ